MLCLLQPGMLVVDPMCGEATILLEAAKQFPVSILTFSLSFIRCLTYRVCPVIKATSVSIKVHLVCVLDDDRV